MDSEGDLNPSEDPPSAKWISGEKEPNEDSIAAVFILKLSEDEDSYTLRYYSSLFLRNEYLRMIMGQISSHLKSYIFRANFESIFYSIQKTSLIPSLVKLSSNYTEMETERFEKERMLSESSMVGLTRNNSTSNTRERERGTDKKLIKPKNDFELSIAYQKEITYLDKQKQNEPQKTIFNFIKAEMQRNQGLVKNSSGFSADEYCFLSGKNILVHVRLVPVAEPQKEEDPKGSFRGSFQESIETQKKANKEKFVRAKMIISFYSLDLSIEHFNDIIQLFRSKISDAVISNYNVTFSRIKELMIKTKIASYFLTSENSSYFTFRIPKMTDKSIFLLFLKNTLLGYMTKVFGNIDQASYDEIFASDLLREEMKEAVAPQHQAGNPIPTCEILMNTDCSDNFFFFSSLKNFSQLGQVLFFLSLGKIQYKQNFCKEFKGKDDLFHNLKMDFQKNESWEAVHMNEDKSLSLNQNCLQNVDLIRSMEMESWSKSEDSDSISILLRYM